MRKKNRLLNRIAVSALLLSMTFTMTGPVTGYAQEEIPAGEEQEVSEGEKVKEEEEKQNLKTDVQTEVKEENAVPDDSDEEPTGQNQTSTEQNSREAGYDVTKPVFENFEFLQQGQTLKDQGVLEFHIEAYDLDSGIQTVEIGLEIGDRWNTLRWTAEEWEYDSQKNQYTCEYTLGKVDTEKIVITQVRVIDQNGNYADWEVRDGSWQPLYWFNTEESNPIRVKSLTIEPEGTVLKENDTVTVTAELEEEIEEDWISIEFAHENGNGYGYSLYRGESGRIYTMETQIDRYWANGTWRIGSLGIEQSGTFRKLLVENIEAYSFIVEKTETDTEKPVIKSVHVDQNGQTCRAGDVVNITVEAADNGQLDNSGHVNFIPTSDIADGYEYVDLTYDENDGLYHGVFNITEDTYPCEWYMSYIGIRDSENNEADCNMYTNEAYYPYYVNVYNGSTFVSPVYEVNMEFLTLNEAGSWESVDRVQKSNVERRQTLKDLGITLPEGVSKYPGLNQTGWQDYNGNEITDNMPILENMGMMTAYARYDKCIVNADYSYTSTNGGYGYKSKVLLLTEGTTYREVKEELVKEEPPSDLYERLQFQKWKAESMSGYGDDEPIKGASNYIRVAAICDKNVVRLTYSYLNKDGAWMETQSPLIVEKGTTYKEAIAEGRKYQPEDMASEPLIGSWAYDLNMVQDENAVIPDGTADAWIHFNAMYDGKMAVIAVRQYYDKAGHNISIPEIMYVEEGTKAEEVIKAINGWEIPKMYEGLRFNGWNTYMPGENIIQSGDYVYANADYDNCIIRYIIDPRFEEQGYDGEDGDVETIICQVAEKGTTVTFPGTVEGYESVTWGNRPAEDNFVVDQDMTFIGYGTKTPVDPDNPDNPDTPDPDNPDNPDTPDPDNPDNPDTPDPDNPDNPDTPDPDNPNNPDTPNPDKPDPDIPNKPAPPNPSISLPETTVSAVVDTINKTQEGEQVRVDMGTATVVPKEVLESAKGKDIDVQLNMGGYTWTINGKDIASNNLQDINLQVTVDTNNIPSSTVQQLAGENPVVQLSLAHEGNFGFKAALTVNMGSEYAGKYGNLFYYDSDGKMVFIDAGRINPDGSVTLNFSHASEYAVVMSDAQMSQASVPAGLQPTENGGKKSPRTGDNNKIMLLILCSVMAMSVIVSMRKRRMA